MRAGNFFILFSFQTWPLFSSRSKTHVPLSAPPEEENNVRRAAGRGRAGRVGPPGARPLRRPRTPAAAPHWPGPVTPFGRCDPIGRPRCPFALRRRRGGEGRGGDVEADVGKGSVARRRPLEAEDGHCNMSAVYSFYFFLVVFCFFLQDRGCCRRWNRNLQVKFYHLKLQAPYLF